MNNKLARSVSRICAAALLLCSLSTLAMAADPEAPPAANDPISIRSVWVNAGFISRHFDRSQNFREGNIGYGLEVGLTDDWAAFGGGFRNSDDEHSDYIGAAWRPLQWGPLRFGVVGGLFDGYPRMEHGGWFPALLPVATIEHGRFGANLLIIPDIGDKVYGAAVLQLKFRLK